jgi:hypothetical protein
MASGPLNVEVGATQSLDDLIENHLKSLFDKLSRPHSLDDIESELATLNDLIYTFKRKDELLEKLIDSTTPEENRCQIRKTLEANRIKVAKNQFELEQLHAKSHQLLERSLLLIMKAQWQIQKEAHKSSGYKLETCDYCEGTGHCVSGRCPLCKGIGTILRPQSKTDSLGTN